MLSLAPRYDLFRIFFPKDFIPEVLQEKYLKVLTSRPYPIQNVNDYLSESIVSCEVLGLDDMISTQAQTGLNKFMSVNHIEPTSNKSFSPHNATPLEWLDRTINITFRLNQGFYNYFILYETIFNRYYKPNIEHLPQMYMCVLNSKGEIAVKFTFEDILFQGIDGLDFSYTQTSRQADVFNANLVYNDIKIEFTPEDYDIFSKTESLKGSYLGTLY